MSGKNIICTYQDLIEASNKDAPIEVTGEYIVVSVENLKRGMYYIAPFYFWSQSKRPMRVEILKPATESTIVAKRDFELSRHLDSSGKDRWTNKRYKLDKSRHNGKAIMRIGWPADEKITASCPFKIVAAPLTSKTLIKEQRIASGLCPSCGKPGDWISMAMVCKEHGVFLG